MTRKHFIELAAMLKANKPREDSEALEDVLIHVAKMQTWEKIVRDTTALCAGQNANFDHSRFRNACGL